MSKRNAKLAANGLARSIQSGEDFAVYWTVGDLTHGPLTFKTLKKAAAKRDEIVAKHGIGVLPVTEPVTVLRVYIKRHAGRGQWEVVPGSERSGIWVFDGQQNENLSRLTR